VAYFLDFVSKMCTWILVQYHDTSVKKFLTLVFYLSCIYLYFLKIRLIIINNWKKCFKNLKILLIKN